MATTMPSQSPSSSSEDTTTNNNIDSTPLLNTSTTSDAIFRSRQFVRGTPSLRGAARFLRRASSRRMLREPSMRVRESAAEQIEERQTDWAYSRPIVILDLIWNLAFIVVSISVLIMSRKEDPQRPLRLWIVGYACQCLLHMVCVCVEYKHRYQQRSSEYGGNLRSEVNNGNPNSNSSSSGSEERENAAFSPDRSSNDDDTSVAKHLESANTMFSFIWWIVGFYWVSSGGQHLTMNAPQLYWFVFLPLGRFNMKIVLCITFLAFDVFFVVICVAVACVVGIAVCCCLPCIIAILYAVADQEGATKDDIERLPKYKFKRIDDFEKENGEIQKGYGGIMVECDTDSPVERALSEEDAPQSIYPDIYLDV
ncbi:hypothetical protein Ccrd_008886 [Cynara cardunculus var. scolymus]|uniref:RING-type E3 ubiquitin transferase n=1 Tax=Cynara cardunculus var. scolymus TaxID=59895 RepID=A0A103XE87_CYNCS|nr:hypothetical protein Ccrd_008886 [Cynara cardunculus var. scolymus]